MRRPSPVWFRALIALWGIWFTAALSEAPGAHTCAVHGTHSAHVAHGMHGAGDAHDAHAMHGAHAAAEQNDHPDQSPPPAACTCLGLCCCASPVAAPAFSLDLAGDILVATLATRYPDVTSPAVRRAYSHPFANGPPAL